MRKFCVYFILLQVFLITDQSGSECLNQRYLAVSLKALQQALRSCTESGNCPDEYNMLGGLTKIDGYVIDNANGDVILYGESLPWKPPLYTEDFVVALRNAWVLYFTQKGNTKYYSNPGCSIDPRPDLHNRLNSVFSNLSRQSISGNDINKMKSQMRRQIEKFSKLGGRVQSAAGCCCSRDPEKYKICPSNCFSGLLYEKNR